MSPGAAFAPAGAAEGCFASQDGALTAQGAGGSCHWHGSVGLGGGGLVGLGCLGGFASFLGGAFACRLLFCGGLGGGVVC